MSEETCFVWNVLSGFSLVEKNLNDAEILERDMQWLSQCQVVVAEVTQPSLGVGFEIARAITLNKPVLCLFRPSSGQRKHRRRDFFAQELFSSSRSVGVDSWFDE